MASMDTKRSREQKLRLLKEKKELEKQIEEEAKARGLVPPVKRNDTRRAAIVEDMQASDRKKREEDNLYNDAPREGEPGSASNPREVATLKVTPPDPRNPPAAVRKSKSPAPAKFDPEPDAGKNPSAWRKWNFKRVKAAKKAGVKPESIAKSSMDKEISERNTYDVSDKKGGRIKTSPKVKRGVGCAHSGYGKAMMGGGKVKAYKAGGKVGGNRLY